MDEDAYGAWSGLMSDGLGVQCSLSGSTACDEASEAKEAWRRVLLGRGKKKVVRASGGAVVGI